MQQDDSSQQPPALNQAKVERLLAGDDDAWRSFLSSYHWLFVNALRVAASKARRPLPLSVAEWPPGLLEDAQFHFYQTFTKRFESYLGEGQFRSWLYGAMLNFMRQSIERLPPAAPEDEESKHEQNSMAAWLAKERSSDNPKKDALHRCLDQLDATLRVTVVLYYFGEALQSISAVAAALGLNVEATSKRFQRGKAFLAACIEARMVNPDAI